MTRSAEAKEHFNKLSTMGCMVCGSKPTVLHHIRGGSASGLAGASMKSSDFLVIVLCPEHHNGTLGIHTIGVKTWEGLYGEQMLHLQRLGLMLKVDLMEKAAEHARAERRSSMTSSKIIPRGEAR